MVDFVQTQYSSRQGEIGDFFRGQSHLQIFHQGLCEAENVIVKTAGNIERRDPVKYICKLPDADAGQYKIVTLTVNENVFSLFFTNNLLTVFRHEDDGTRVTKCFDKETQYSLDRMNFSWHCLVHGEKAEDMDDAVVFTNKNHKPLSLVILNDGLSANDYVFKELTPANLPMKRVTKDDITGTQANTGNVVCEYKFSQWLLTTTNVVFLDNTWIGAEFDIGGATWRIQSILPSGGGKMVSCALIKGAVAKYEVPQTEIFFRKGYEVIASDDKGWFGCCAFCNGRLFLANGKKEPDVIVGSCFNNLLDFDLNIAENQDAVFAELPLESGEYITSIKCTSSIYAFTNKGLFVCPTVDVTPKNFIFTRSQAEGGVDAYTETQQLAENGLIGISSEKNKIYYYQFSDESNAFKAAPISPVMEPRMIAQSNGLFNATVIDEGKTIGQNFYYITSDFDIVKILLTFEKDIVPGYTRYDFSDRYLPVKIFSCKGKLFVVFRDSVTHGCFLTYLDNSITENGAPVFKERPCVDFYIEIDNREGVEDLKAIELPNWIDAEDDVWFITNREFFAAKVTRQGQNQYRCPIPIKNGHFGVFFAPYIETMETSGSPESVGGQGFGKLKCIKSLSFGAQSCFSELKLAVIDAIATDIPDRKEKPRYFTYINKPNKSPQYAIQGICDIPGVKLNPTLCITQSKPGIFYFSGYSVLVGMAGGVLGK